MFFHEITSNTKCNHNQKAQRINDITAKYPTRQVQCANQHVTSKSSTRRNYGDDKYIVDWEFPQSDWGYFGHQSEYRTFEIYITDENYSKTDHVLWNTHNAIIGCGDLPFLHPVDAVIDHKENCFIVHH